MTSSSPYPPEQPGLSAITPESSCVKCLFTSRRWNSKWLGAHCSITTHHTAGSGSSLPVSPALWVPPLPLKGPRIPPSASQRELGKKNNPLRRRDFGAHERPAKRYPIKMRQTLSEPRDGAERRQEHDASTRSSVCRGFNMTRVRLSSPSDCP